MRRELLGACRILHVQAQEAAEGKLVDDIDDLNICGNKNLIGAQTTEAACHKPDVQNILARACRDAVTGVQGSRVILLNGPVVDVVSATALRVDPIAAPAGLIGVCRKVDRRCAQRQNIGIGLRGRCGDSCRIFGDACLNGGRGLNVVLIERVGRQRICRSRARRRPCLPPRPDLAMSWHLR